MKAIHFLFYFINFIGIGKYVILNLMPTTCSNTLERGNKSLGKLWTALKTRVQNISQVNRFTGSRWEDHDFIWKGTSSKGSVVVVIVFKTIFTFFAQKQTKPFMSSHFSSALSKQGKQ